METAARWGSASALLPGNSNRMGEDGLRAGSGWILGKNYPPREQSGSSTVSDGVTVPRGVQGLRRCGTVGGGYGHVGWVGVLRGFFFYNLNDAMILRSFILQPSEQRLFQHCSKQT